MPGPSIFARLGSDESLCGPRGIVEPRHIRVAVPNTRFDWNDAATVDRVLLPSKLFNKVWGHKLDFWRSAGEIGIGAIAAKIYLRDIFEELPYKKIKILLFYFPNFTARHDISNTLIVTLLALKENLNEY